MTAVLNTKSVGNDSLAFEIRLPVERGLEAVHFLSDSLVRSARNYVRGKPSASVVGAPAVGNGFLSMVGGSAYLQTAIAETNEQTFIAIVRNTDTLADDAHRPTFVGNYRGPWTAHDDLLSAGAGMMITSLTQTSLYIGRSADGATLSNQVFNSTMIPTAFQMLVGRVSETGASLWNLTTNVRPADTTNNSPRARNINKHLIGSAYSRYLGKSDMALAAIASAYWTDAEVLENAKRLARVQELRFGMNGLINAALY